MKMAALSVGHDDGHNLGRNTDIIFEGGLARMFSGTNRLADKDHINLFCAANVKLPGRHSKNRCNEENQHKQAANLRTLQRMHTHMHSPRIQQQS